MSLRPMGVPINKGGKQHQQQYKSGTQDVALSLEEHRLAQLKDFRDINYIVVAAIDFGSTYSGYAFSTRFNYKTRPLEVSSAVWNAGSGTMQSQKTATCILFNPDKSFHSFGYEAENYYAELVESGTHEGWYFFHRFKMQLYNKETITWDMPLSTVDGKTLPALKVFTECIKYLKDQMLELCEKQGLVVHRPDIRWVVTVPAIWSDDAKQFMRKAAEKSDIPGPQLFLALEAEAAALYCKHLPADRMVVRPEDHITAFSPSSKYMILDVGGGTVDITVHEVQNDLTLKEVHMATGGNWGGLEVDDAFESLMIEVVGDEVYQQFKTNHPSDMLELHRSFEVKKRTIKRDDKKTTVSVPLSLFNTYQSVNPNKDISEEIKKNKKLKGEVTWQFDKIRISNKLAVSLFEKSLTNTRDHLKSLFSLPEVQDISVILMVGGYSECPLLQSMVKETFPDKKLIVPNEAGLAILKGAVINGHEPDTITERICRHSYGIRVCTPFNPICHPMEFMFLAEEGLYCANIFSIHLEKNQHIPLFLVGEPHTYQVVDRNAQQITIELHVSTDKDPMFVTEPSCRKLGSMIFELRDTSKGLDRGVKVSITLGGAELQVQATDIHTNKRRFGYFDFLGTPSEKELDEMLK